MLCVDVVFAVMLVWLVYSCVTSVHRVQQYLDNSECTKQYVRTNCCDHEYKQFAVCRYSVPTRYMVYPLVRAYKGSDVLCWETRDRD